ncbi:hypothetical protein L1049_017916 [Liquidambar formosana]|uniref:Uncharacterized protein n=1 Tax=Liquidambar formosana TaxID=63359 RepID=A0AAP0NN09_LIQFO
MSDSDGLLCAEICGREICLTATAKGNMSSTLVTVEDEDIQRELGIKPFVKAGGLYIDFDGKEEVRHATRKEAPPGQCNQENDFDCCVQGRLYPIYKCSPVSSQTKVHVTINNFEKGGDGGGPLEWDNQYHSDNTPVVALSTGWFNKKGRCLNNITISANGRSIVAMVVDECDSTMGCDKDHDYQPPCDNDIIDASKAV